MATSKTDLAWAAGFFEGEGCVARQGYTKNGKGYRYLRLIVVNTDRATIEKFHEMFGGSITMRTRPKKPHHKQQWYWAVVGARATEVFGQLLPYFQSTAKLDRFNEIMDEVSNGHNP